MKKSDARRKAAVEVPVVEAPSPGRLKLRRRVFRGLLAGLAVFCGYRLATFHLLALDSPGTLHEWLWPLFAWFRSSYPEMSESQRAWIQWGLLPLFLPVALVLLHLIPLRAGVRRILCSRGLFFCSVAVCLVYWRFPLLLGGDSNPDEAEFLTAATKLLADPVFFRSIESNTSGPLNIFPLAIPALFGISPDYATTRVIGLAVIFLSLYVLERALREMGPGGPARAAILPALGFFSLATYPDFVHYSSELIPMLVISLAVLACVRVIREPGRAARYLPWLGCLVAVGFFAKPQSTPILAAAAAVGASAVYASGEAGRWWRPAQLLAVGFAPLPVLILAILASVGALHEFWVAFLVANWKYGRAAGGNFFAELPALGASILMRGEIQLLVLALLVTVAGAIFASFHMGGSRRWRQAAGVWVTAAIAAAVLVAFQIYGKPGGRQLGCSLILVIAAAGIAFLAVRGFLPDRRVGMLGILGAAILGAALFSIYASHLILPHYTELLIVPISTVAGWLLIRFGGGRGIALAACLIAATVGGEIALLRNVGYNLYAAQDKMALPEGRLIGKLTAPGSSIVVWGWRPEIYSSAGRIPATRDTNMSRFFNYGRDLNLHYRERFLRDVKRNRPELIVDAVDTSCCGLNDRNVHAFELIPEIRSYIEANYVLVAEQYRERFYLRRDLRAGQ